MKLNVLTTLTTIPILVMPSRDMNAYVHTEKAQGSFIYNNPKMEIAQVLVNKWMDK